MRSSTTPLRAVVAALVAAALSVAVAAQLPPEPPSTQSAPTHALD